MYSPTLGRFITKDPSGFQAGDVNLYRFVGNNPTNATDPSGLQEQKLGLQLIDYGPAVAADPLNDIPGARTTSQDKLKETLSDGKLGYAFTFNFVVPNKYANDRRYLLQAVKHSLIVVAPDGSVSRASNYNIDQGLIAAPPKPGRPSLAQDIRGAGPYGAFFGGTVAGDPKKTTPAVFALEIVEAEAGLSKLKYDTVKKPSGGWGLTEYNQVLGAIELFRTKTTSHYVFYNPNNCKGQANVGQFVLDSLNKYDPAVRKQVEEVLKQLKLTLGAKPFEAYSFPEFGPPVVGYPK
jgi:hypothetical protein